MKKKIAPLSGSKLGPCKGFTLVELLAVIAIIALVAAVVVPTVSGLKTADTVNQASNRISGALERGRAFAQANNTYVWVGFFEKDSGDASRPATKGTGEVLISIIASKEGTNSLGQPSPLLKQIYPLISLKDIHLDQITAAELDRPTLPPSEFQVGHSDFESNQSFTYPLGESSNYLARFISIIQFDPNGDARKVDAASARELEIGIRLAQGGQIVPNNNNVVAIQVAGITGRIKAYRK